MPNPENIIPHQWKPGESGNLAGRPRKLIAGALIEGYKQSEINDTLMKMAAMTLDELKQVFEDNASTMLERIVAKALKNSLTKGSLWNIETIISRAHGTPKQTVDNNLTGDVDLTLNIT